MKDQRRAHLDALAVASLLLCAALWGLNQTASKVAVAEIPPLLQAALRSAGAALLLGAWAAVRRLPLRPAAGTPHTLAPGLLAGALFALEFGCIFVGLQYTSASRMAVFIYLAPFFVALGMPWIAPGETLRGWQLAGLVIAFAGVATAFGESFSTGTGVNDRQWWGDALGVAGAALWAGTTLTIRATALSNAPAEQTLMYQLVVSALLLGAASQLAGEAWPAAASPLAWAALAFQTVIVTFASYLLWFWLIRHYPATQISSFTLLTPIFGLAAGVGLLGEPLTLRLVLALAAVSGGIALVSRRPRSA
ncbi:DMT family transporter [Ideonella sp.]|uniref:DMT family transporter n=1 Tax=Ideonella sp. TaxID=1929293 RepID=UPI002B47BF04|nr:DMT family transporter [Ideonella sp.]HJV72216.1 DMT family transporter [Ideonella sp.]